jgi:hypothetical protein
MKLLRMVALGAAGVIAYRLWKQRQPARAPMTEHAIDDGDASPPHGDALLDTDAAESTSEPAVAAAQFSRGFGET